MDDKLREMPKNEDGHREDDASRQFRAPLISRRGALAGAAGAALALVAPRSLAAAETDRLSPVSPPLPIREPNLYVFQASRPGNVVIAVTFIREDGAATGSAGARFKVRIQSNERSWSVAENGFGENGARRAGSRGLFSFAGRVRGEDADAISDRMAVVLEVPRDSVGGREDWKVWAEILPASGARIRVGNPFVTELLGSNPILWERHHAVSPGEDTALFADTIAKRAEALARFDGSVADPRTHGLRVAERVLPNVLRYSPARPAGFTFASQNGRHPGDETGAVVRTILSGAVTRSEARFSIPWGEEFPYFQTVAAI